MTEPTHLEIVQSIEEDFDAERYKRGIERTAALDLASLDQDAWEHLIPLALRSRRFAGEAPDKLAVDAKKALERARPGAARALLHAEIAYGYVAKRLPVLAERECGFVAREWADDSLAPAVRGYMAWQLDRRDEALAAYAEATKRARPNRGHFGLARVRFVVGDFDGALAEAKIIEDDPRYRVAILRLRANVARVRGDFPEVLAITERLLAITPDGDNRRGDRAERASTLAAMGRREEAIEAYREIWREDGKDGVGRFCREILNHVERGSGHARALLKAFPTVEQKRNYCGPASLELVLRALGKDDLDQDAIAVEVKTERGSSLLAMTRFLEGQGLAVRRFEGTGARFHACIELGLPAIVQEEYSTTSHVAVVSGVDESMGLLFVQDPMTHVPSERLLSTQDRLGSLYRGAALVAYPKDDARVAAALDAGDVIDQPHLRIVDSTGDKEVEADPAEVIERCDRAIALVPDYPYAWYRRALALQNILGKARSETNRARFLKALREARGKYHALEWPHLVHGRYLMDEGRHEEALIELENAARVDPDDSDTAQDMAQCHERLGRTDESIACFWRAVGNDPAHRFATENFTAVALAAGDVDLAEHLSACALEGNPENPFNHVTASQIAEKRGDLDRAIASARRAVEIAPRYHHGSMRLAEVLRASSDEKLRAEATEVYLGLSERFPQWFEGRWRAARGLEEVGRVDEAVTLLERGLEIAEDDPARLLSHLTSILFEAGRGEEAVAAARRFAKARPTSDMQEELWSALDEHGLEPEAAAETAAFLAVNDWPFSRFHRAKRIVGSSEAADTEAEALLRQAVERSPAYREARTELAHLLARDRVDEALAVLAGDPDGGCDVERVLMLVDHERFEEAEKLFAEVDPTDGDWTDQNAFTLVALGNDTPRAAYDRLARGGDESERVILARVTLASAACRWDDLADDLARVPLDSTIGCYMAYAAAAENDAFRDDLDRRLGAILAKPHLGHGSRRYFDAIRIGNDAARGDRAAFDRALAEERNPHFFVNLKRSLSSHRHRDLMEALERRYGELPGQLSGRATMAEFRGDHARAIELERIAHEHDPREKGPLRALAIEHWMLGEDGAAQVWVQKLAAIPAPWVHELAVLALGKLFAGDREGAATIARRAWRRAHASGYQRATYPFLMAASAAIGGDREGIALAKAIESTHVDRDGKLWSKLESLCGR